MAELWLHIPINPEPWAVGPVGAARHGGKIHGFMGQNKQLHAYQEGVREELRSQWGDLPLLTPPFALSLYFWRNRAEYTTPNQRQHRKHEADATNMQKAFEDAMQGIIFENDRDNIIVKSQIVTQGPEVAGQVVVCIESSLNQAAEGTAAILMMPEKIVDKITLHSMTSATPPSYLDDNVWPPRDWPPKDGITR